MTTIPEGAPRSEDGYYWWDGSQWQPVQGADAASSATAAAAGAAGSGPADAQAGAQGDAKRNAPEIAFNSDMGAEVSAPEVEAS